jgi:D-apionate oxidoisomerase
VTTIAIVGAGGNMGGRVSRTLKKNSEYSLLYLEVSELGQQKVLERGDALCSREDAVARADVLLLAVPDKLVGRVAQELVPDLKTGCVVMVLDPAAPFAGHLPARADVAYFVTHPCHPPVFNDDEGEARRDFFGSGLARQSVVSALMQGSEADFLLGEQVAKDAFGPILRSHRVTVEQMVMLEPAMSETVVATLCSIMREALDEVVARGVPEAAARDFMMGHINIPLAIVFEEIQWDFSAGAKQAIQDGKLEIMQPDWKKVFEWENIRSSVAKITGEVRG